MSNKLIGNLALLAACIIYGTNSALAAQQILNTCDSTTGWTTVAPATVSVVPGANANALRVAFTATNAPNPGGGPSAGGLRLRNSNDNSFYPAGGSANYGAIRFWVRGDASTKWGNLMFRYGANYTRAWALFPVTPNWTEVTIPWREFFQQNFDGTMDTHYKETFWIEFTSGFTQTYGHPLSGLPAQAYEIDDLRFVDGVNLPATPQPQGNSIKNTVAKLKAQQPVKIVVMGASISWGLQTSNPAQDHWPLKLQALLRARYGYNNIEVVNAAVPGFNSWEGACAAGAYIFSQEPVDLVMAADWCYNDFPDTDQQAAGVAQIVENYKAFFGLVLRRGNSEVMHIQSGLNCEAGNFNLLDSTNTALSTLCDTMNVYKADVYGIFKAQGQPWLTANYYTIAGDYAHFNAAGHTRVSEIVRDAFVAAESSNNPPVISTAAASPTSAQVGTPISFTASGTDADGDTISYAWTFGDGASASSANTTHGYATAGTFTATVTASDGKGGTATRNVSITITSIPVTPNIPPSVTSQATASPASAATGEAITFAVAGTDPEGKPLTFTWYFNDGTTALGESASHAYSAGGNYTVIVVIDDGNGGRVSSQVLVTITAPAGGGGATPNEFADSDGDGVSDVNEATDGTDPLSASSLKKRPMSVSKLRAGLSFKRVAQDKITFTAILSGVAAGKTFANSTLTLNAGGASASFALSDKAKGSSSLGQARLKMKTTRDKATGKRNFSGGDIAVSISLKRGTWASTWSDDGVVDSTVKSLKLTFPVEIAFLGLVYRSEVPVSYSAKQGLGGTLKQ